MSGVVQGVGFRPYVYKLAFRYGLSGYVLNSEAGIAIEVQGTAADVDAFLQALPAEAPLLAHVLEVRTTQLALSDEQGFSIHESTRSDRANTLLSPDIATCEDCVREMFDPADRRYHYPFTNCTNCGPRFTIIRSVPYDRRQTSMAAFTMCVRCQAEYDDPLDRRFHAQPNACWTCGPQVQLVMANGEAAAGNPMSEAIRLLHDGSILAVKGLGGFHLAVDAENLAAVDELRLRKGRRQKPFAVMVRDVAAAQQFCFVSEQEGKLLQSVERPIVLLRKRSREFDALAPDVHELGVFLPYTPLHHLLLENGDLRALVMTSANLSEEPIAIDNHEAMVRLRRVADNFLLHDRDILLRCDDSVVRRAPDSTQWVRRSRGFVPLPILLGEGGASVLAVGGELKNAICMSRGRYAFVGQHVGDMENLTAHNFFKESIAHFKAILEVQPDVIAHDLHPGYLSTQWAKQQQIDHASVRLVGVQHHHAHVASCMAEHRLAGSVVGVALDGTGFGLDGHTWGGEILVADLQDFTRVAHFAYTPMPGGEKSVHEPWRMAVACLRQTFGDAWRDFLPADCFGDVAEREIRFVEQLLRANIRSPLTSSCGRLFDAVAALVCRKTTVSYEAQAAVMLEACCGEFSTGADDDAGAYHFPVSEGPAAVIGTSTLFSALADDLRNDVSPEMMSRRFHSGLIKVLEHVVIDVALKHQLDRVCLSGGCFQNVILAEGLKRALRSAGLEVFTHSQVPPGDGGLSLGQLAIATHRLAKTAGL